MLSNPWRGQCSCPTQVLWRLRGTCTFPSPSQFLNCVNCVNCVILFPDILQYWQGCLNIQGNCHSLWWGDVGNHWDCGGPLICLARSGWIQRGCGTGSTNVNKITQFAVPRSVTRGYETLWNNLDEPKGCPLVKLWVGTVSKKNRCINAAACGVRQTTQDACYRFILLPIIAAQYKYECFWMIMNVIESTQYISVFVQFTVSWGNRVCFHTDSAIGYTHTYMHRHNITRYNTYIII
jgi:hypothetical protein